METNQQEHQAVDHGSEARGFSASFWASLVVVNFTTGNFAKRDWTCALAQKDAWRSLPIPNFPPFSEGPRLPGNHQPHFWYHEPN